MNKIDDLEEQITITGFNSLYFDQIFWKCDLSPIKDPESPYYFLKEIVPLD